MCDGGNTGYYGHAGDRDDRALHIGKGYMEGPIRFWKIKENISCPYAGKILVENDQDFVILRFERCNRASSDNKICVRTFLWKILYLYDKMCL